MDFISVRGARTHNLKNIDINIPKNKLVVVTGVSGSGKSSLAFDTLFAEGQRRYVESLSTYARQFLGVLEKPDVDSIEGLSPAIAIEQKTGNHNPRSTVGTVTEIHDYLRLLFARTGEQNCPTHNIALRSYSVSQMLDHIYANANNNRILILSKPRKIRSHKAKNTIERHRARGFFRVRINGTILDLDETEKLDLEETIELSLVVDRIKVTSDIRGRITESIETALGQDDSGILILNVDTGEEQILSTLFQCPKCDYTSPPLEPRMFSFNHPKGACEKCDGIGEREVFDPEKIIAYPTLSLASGAIKGWDRKNQFYFDLLKDLSAHYDFDLEMPYEELPEKIKNVIVNGSGSETIRFGFRAPDMKSRTEIHAFEGVVNNFTRRYKNATEPAIKETLASFISVKPCDGCEGTRLRPESSNVTVNDKTIAKINRMSLSQASEFFKTLDQNSKIKLISDRVISEIINRIQFLLDVGLGYLTLERNASTLSGGETQRIRLASQIGAGLSGVMYVLDEPSIGLHQKDNDRLIDSLKHLRDLGNTVIVVEHDEEMIRQADHVIDIGPGSGTKGGSILACGSNSEILKDENSITGQYLSGAKKIVDVNKICITPETQTIELKGATANNLKNVNLKIPIGAFVCITGVSGSGKSTLINDTFVPALSRRLGIRTKKQAKYESISENDDIRFLVNVNQNAIGKTPRSNPATYTGMFSIIRDLFAQVPLARERGYSAGRFSFNVKGGRCETCQGDGSIRIELHFLPDVFVRCETCQGQRYNQETLDINYKGKSITEVLELSVDEALEFFASVPSLAKRLKTMSDVGLGYISLGQSATTLSGGEAQRVKLANELSKRNSGKTMFVLDEPTTGLHFRDISWLLLVLIKLRDQGNSILVVEHNLDVISRADWIVDLGPEGGANGGYIVASGSPASISEKKYSMTGKFLANHIAKTTTNKKTGK